MNQITLAIADYNAGRDPERLRRKLALIAADPFAFMRGTCHLFYAGLSALPAAPVLRAAPRVWICGDLHLENFGTFKGDNRLVYFDLNDFDETRPSRLSRSIWCAWPPASGWPRKACVWVRGRRGQSGGPDGNFLMDIKCAAPSALKPRLTGPQPEWESEARRVLTIQTIVQAAPQALLGTAALGGASFFVKELQPAADRLNLPL